MKLKLTLLAVLFSFVSIAQNGINYKAIIKDSNGNVVANDIVVVQFTILQGVAQTNVYQETHSPTTNANGLIIVNIGEGTPVSGTFATLNWGSDAHFLNVQINTGTGLVDMGTTEFKTVPYALSAQTVKDKVFVSGNDKTYTANITDNFIVGSHFMGFTGDSENDNTHRMFFNKAKAAFRAGSAGSIFLGQYFGEFDAWNDNNVGENSFASGADTKASGFASTAMGNQSIASGEASFAIGNNNINELNSFTIASGVKSIAMGSNSEASNEGAIAIGKENLVSGYISSSLGTANTVSGNESIALGTANTVSGDYSTALGGANAATANYTTSLGSFTIASGQYATSIGNGSTASGGASTAMGRNTVASGENSTAMGYGTKALGYYSTAMGRYTTASSYNALAVGKYNVGLGNPYSWIETDPLFEVGFGTSNANRLNALTVLKNGKIGIGTHTPTTFLQVTNGYNATLSDGTGYFLIGRETGTNIVFDNNEIMARNNGATSTLYLQHSGGDVRVGGVLVHSSDRRLKKDITPLAYGLETILQLNPVAYNWIDRTQDHKSLGLIAQEVQPIINEIVHIDDDEAKTLSVSYTELVPVLIKAIQEQQKIIDSQNKTISGQSTALQSLLERVEALETKTKNKYVITNEE